MDIRGNGGMFVAPYSLHKSGRNYVWEASCDPADVPVATMPDWLVELLIKPKTDRETEDTEKAEETENTEDTEATPAASVSPSLCLSVSQAIELTLPDRVGQRNRKLFDFARALKSVPSLANAPVRDLKSAVRKWHEAALSVIGTKSFDETWAEFSYSWPRVRIPLGEETLARALKSADEATLPHALAESYDSPSTHRLLKLCRELQRLTGDQPFFLSCRSAGKLLSIDHDGASKLLGMLVSDGVLLQAKKGTMRTATRYRYVGEAMR